MRGARRAFSAKAVACLLLAFALTACAGTPAPQTAAADPRKGDGIGGTGISVAETRSGDGIGGTGVVGTISGFGSIIVNGLKLEFDRGTAVVNDGRPSTLEELRVGQVVQGTARHRGEQLYLESLEIHHAVTGPISSIDHTAEILTVLGQNIRVNLADDKTAMAAFKTLQPGDMVSVSGLRMADGAIIASRVDQQLDDGRIVVRGQASAVGADSVRVGGLDIPLTGGTVVSSPVLGGRVFASGRVINGQFVPDVITGGSAMPFGQGIVDVSLEGYAPTVNGPFVMQGVTIDGASLPAGTAAGDHMVVTGHISGPDHVTATSISKVRTTVTILRARGSMRPAALRPNVERPERVPPRPVERPTTPERPQIERPEIERPANTSLPIG